MANQAGLPEPFLQMDESAVRRVSQATIQKDTQLPGVRDATLVFR